MTTPIKNRYEFVMLYDVENGNPNGDPDAGNMPRIDPETGHGIVTDVCIKRKIRNYVDMVKDGEEGFDIYIKQGVPLNDSDNKALEATSVKKDKIQKGEPAKVLAHMCGAYYDIRTFGAVITTLAGTNGGQVRGPVQLTFGKSVNPIVPQELSITRLVDVKEEDKHTMGRKHIVPYALYRQEGFISANLAQRVTGFSEADLELLWEAIANMFEFDRSAARGKMTLRELIIFKHDCVLGNAPAHRLFDLVTVERKSNVKVPRAYSDYIVSVANAPSGVTIDRRTQ